MSFLRRAIAERRAGEFGDSSIPPNSSSFAPGGMGIGEYGAMAIGAVLSCVRVLANDVSGLPFGGYSESYAAGKRPLRPAPPIIAEPFGPDLSPQDGFGQVVVSLAFRGNAYAKVTLRDRFGFPTQLLVLHPDTVRVYRDDNGRKAFKVRFEDVNPDDMVHIPGLMLPGALVGIDPITAYRLTLQTASDVDTYAAGFFRNGSSPSGVIKVNGPGDAKKAREVKAAWEVGNSGVANAHRTAVLFGGAEWQQITVTPEQAQFLETKKFQREEIAGMFGVPLHRIMAIVDKASQGGGKGLETLDTGYAVHTLVPYCSRIENRWTRMIRGGRTYARFDLKGFLRADALTRAQIHMLGRTGGWMNRDEIRDDEGLPPLPDGTGQDYDAPLNSAHAGDANTSEQDGSIQ